MNFIINWLFNIVLFIWWLWFNGSLFNDLDGWLLLTPTKIRENMKYVCWNCNETANWFRNCVKLWLELFEKLLEWIECWSCVCGKGGGFFCDRRQRRHGDSKCRLALRPLGKHHSPTSLTDKMQNVFFLLFRKLISILVNTELFICHLWLSVV